MIFQIRRLKFCIVIALVALVFITVMPVSATLFNGYYRVAPEIEQGATVFIGEQGLDITPAMIAANNGTALTTIGWWVSAADIYTMAPTISVETMTRQEAFNVTQAEFDGYEGQWYLVDPALDNTAKRDAGAVFNVISPKLEISIRDTGQSGADVSGMSIPTGTKLKFQIGTNMYSVLGGLRTPVYGNAAGDGYLDIIVRNESGFTFLKLYGDNDGLHNLTSLNVSIQPYFWGADYVWNTSASNPSGEKAYPPGTYVVSVQSKLNNIFDNYRSGGAPYTGRTVSETKTITLVPETVNIVADEDSVVRTNPFSVTITGVPSTWYNVWVRNTSDMNIDTYDGAPPIITKFQTNVLDGNFSTFGYKYQNGGGTNTVGMNAYGQSGVWFQNASYVYSYALVRTNPAGTRILEFSTTHNTKAQMYTVLVERNLNDNNYAQGDFRGDEVDVNVEKDAVTPSKIGVVRNNKTWLLDASGNGAYGAGDLTYTFGIAGDRYVTGDWNGNGTTKIGVVRNNKTWILDASGNGAYGAGDLIYTFGMAGDVYVTGDWNNDNETEIGVVRTNTTWLLDASGDGKWGPGDYRYTFGKAGDVYVTGDWNNDHKTEIGVVRNNKTWLLDASGNGAYGAGDLTYTFGVAGDRYITGDWNGNGTTRIGVIRSNTTWLLDASGNGKWGPGDYQYTFGKAGDRYVTGRWS